MDPITIIGLLTTGLPPIIQFFSNLISTLRDAEGTSEEQRAQLDALSARLNETNRAVQAVEIRQV